MESFYWNVLSIVFVYIFLVIVGYVVVVDINGVGGFFWEVLGVGCMVGVCEK